MLQQNLDRYTSLNQKQNRSLIDLLFHVWEILKNSLYQFFFVFFVFNIFFLSISSTPSNKLSRLFFQKNTKLNSMNMYTYVPLFNTPREYFFAFRIINLNIYFISFANFWNSTSTQTICFSSLCLYEFERLHDKIFLENINNRF